MPRRRRPVDSGQGARGAEAMKDGQTIIAEIGATIASTLEVGDVMATIARQVGQAFGV